MTRAQWAVLVKLQRCEGVKQAELADALDLAVADAPPAAAPEPVAAAPKPKPKTQVPPPPKPLPVARAPKADAPANPFVTQVLGLAGAPITLPSAAFFPSRPPAGGQSARLSVAQNDAAQSRCALIYWLRG